MNMCREQIFRGKYSLLHRIEGVRKLVVETTTEHSAPKNLTNYITRNVDLCTVTHIIIRNVKYC